LNIPARGKWIVFKTTLNNQFIASDNPGYCQDQENNIYNTKFGGCFIFFFPLTPYHHLGIFSEGDYIKQLPSFKDVSYEHIGADWVGTINRATWMTANKEIYGTNEKSLLQVWYSFNSKLII
jgi:hypothetical protein